MRRCLRYLLIVAWGHRLVCPVTDRLIRWVYVRGFLHRWSFWMRWKEEIRQLSSQNICSLRTIPGKIYNIMIDLNYCNPLPWNLFYFGYCVYVHACACVWMRAPTWSLVQHDLLVINIPVGVVFLLLLFFLLLWFSYCCGFFLILLFLLMFVL